MESLEPDVPLLLATPDSRLRRALAKALTAGGYQVTCAEDGIETLELARDGRFAVAVADMDLPRLDGSRLASELLDVDPYLEIVLLAEPADLPRVIDAADVGNVFNHFWKPVRDLGDVARMVARALDRRELRRVNAYLLGEARDCRSELRGLHNKLEQLDKVTALGHMTSAVARDLERPMVSLLGYAKYLRSRLERPDGATLTPEQVDRVIEYMQEMEIGLRRCYDAVQGMRDYSQTHLEPPGPIDAHSALAEAIGLVQHNLGVQGTELVVRLAEATPLVIGNPRRLQQAVLNVLVNAQQALKSGGKITVETEVLLDDKGMEIGLALRVSDSGPGVPPSVLPYVFDPFYTTHAASENLGLGLTIARSIVRGWNGDVDVESASEGGTVVTFMLPLCAEVVVPVSDSDTNGARQQKAA